MADIGRLVSTDIETTTQVDGVPEDAIPGLDARYGAVTDVAVIVDDPDGPRRGYVVSVGPVVPVARHVDGVTVLAPAGPLTVEVAGVGQVVQQTVSTERELLQITAGLFVSTTLDPDVVFCGWNTATFDLPYLHDRMVLHGIDVPFVLRPDPDVYVKYDPLPGHDGGYRAMVGQARHLDIQAVFKSWAEARGVKHSLKPVGIEAGFDPIQVDQTRMHELPLVERVAYVLSDVDVVASLIRRFADELDLASHIDPAFETVSLGV